MSDLDNSEWVERTLFDLLVHHESGIYKKRDLYGTGTNIVGVSDLYRARSIDGQQFRQVPLTKAEEQRYTLDEGDLIYGESSLVREGIAKTLYVTPKGVGTAYAWHTRRFKVKRKLVDPCFLYYYLSAAKARRQLAAVATQTALTGITTRDFFGIDICIPENVNEQRKIARILTTLDNLIEKTEALIAKYQSIKQGMMHDLFTRGVDAHGRLRPTHEQAPDLYKQSELGWIPNEWEVLPCENLCSNVSVGIVIQPAKYYETIGVPVLRSANVRETGITTKDLVFMSEQSNLFHAKSILREGDVVTVRTGYPGTTAVIPAELDGCNCVDILISRPNSVRPHYLAAWVNSDFGRGQVLRKQGGLAQQHFNVGEMRELLVALPPAKEQQAIETILLTQKTRVEAEQTHLRKLQQTKSGLMQDLLTGKVRVNVE